MIAGLPRVTAAAGCGGSGRELARFGDLAELDAVLIGPIGLSAARRATEILPTPSGLVHSGAVPLPVAHVLEDLLPWFRARGLRVVCAVRGETTGGVVEILQQLRRSLDFATVVGVEVDLCAERGESRPALAGVARSDPAGPWSHDPQACLKLLAACREQLPRDLMLTAKLAGECPDPLATARAGVGGGARALVLSGGVPAAPLSQAGGAPPEDDPPSGWQLVGPAVGPIAIGLLARLRAAMAQGRVPDVPLVAVGGIGTAATARRARAAGASAVQVGSGLLSDPEVLWTVHRALVDIPAPPPPTRQSAPETTTGSVPARDRGEHHVS